MEGVYSKVKLIEDDGIEDVYCLAMPETGNFVANGIVIKNCDALRYACTPFMKTGEFSNPDEMLSIEQLRKKIYEDQYEYLDGGGGGPIY